MCVFACVCGCVCLNHIFKHCLLPTQLKTLQTVIPSCLSSLNVHMLFQCPYQVNACCKHLCFTEGSPEPLRKKQRQHNGDTVLSAAGSNGAGAHIAHIHIHIHTHTQHTTHMLIHTLIATQNTHTHTFILTNTHTLILTNTNIIFTGVLAAASLSSKAGAATASETISSAARVVVGSASKSAPWMCTGLVGHVSQVRCLLVV